jgi:hypothetical protein
MRGGVKMFNFITYSLVTAIWAVLVYASGVGIRNGWLTIQGDASVYTKTLAGIGIAAICAPFLFLLILFIKRKKRSETPNLDPIDHTAPTEVDNVMGEKRW